MKQIPFNLDAMLKASGESKPLQNHACTRKTALFGLSIVFSLVFSLGCKKAISGNEEVNALPHSQMGAEQVNLANDPMLLPQTLRELKQAKSATARYQNINNALADGYVDIDVVRENMGYHFLKSTLLDGHFDPSKPEILVYNKKHNGKQELVALEYAVPINLTPDEAPQGFTGMADVWKRDTDFGLWLLHAWVWTYNPAGVFNPTNPLVHLH